MNVWVDGWQMQCCGTPFAVGDDVEWTLSSGCDIAWLKRVVGPEIANSISASEEHHGGLPDGAPTPNGVVTGIRAAWSEFAALPGGDPRTLHPVAGTQELVQVDRADGWERERQGLEFNGYVVELDLHDSPGR